MSTVIFPTQPDLSNTGEGTDEVVTPSYTLTPIIHACGYWVLEGSSNMGDADEYNFKYLEKTPKQIALHVPSKSNNNIFTNATNVDELKEFSVEHKPNIIIMYLDIGKNLHKDLLCRNQEIKLINLINYTNKVYEGMHTAILRNQYIELTENIQLCSGLVFENCIINITTNTQTFEFKNCSFSNCYFLHKQGHYIPSEPDVRFNPNPDTKLVINHLHRISVDNRLFIKFTDTTFNNVVFQGLLTKELQFSNCDFNNDSVSIKCSRIDKMVLDVMSFKKRDTDSLFIKASYINKLYWKKYNIKVDGDDSPLVKRLTILNSSVGKISFDPMLKTYVKPSSVTISGFVMTILRSKECLRQGLKSALDITWINPDGDNDTQIASNVYVNSDPITNTEITKEKLAKWLKDYFTSYYAKSSLNVDVSIINSIADSLFESYKLILCEEEVEEITSGGSTDVEGPLVPEEVKQEPTDDGQDADTEQPKLGTEGAGEQQPTATEGVQRVVVTEVAVTDNQDEQQGTVTQQGDGA